MTRKRRSIYIQYILCFSSRKCIRKQKKHHLTSIYIQIAISWGSQDWSVWSTNKSATQSGKTSTNLAQSTMHENIITVTGQFKGWGVWECWSMWEESWETNDEKFSKISALYAPRKSQDNTNQQRPLERYISKTEEQIDKKQETSAFITTKTKY